nr:LysR family transcriptional regulator [Neptunicella marina]
MDCTKAFLLVAQHNSFSAAASKMGVSASNISKKVRFLESQLNSSLLVRTTRNVNLTTSGKMYAQKMRHLLTEIDDTIQSLQQLTDQPKGWLRIGANTLIGSKVVSGCLPAFLATYPDVQVELDVLPIGAPPNSNNDITITTSNYEIDSLSFRRVRLASYEIGFYAAPAFIKRFGQVETMTQLEACPFVLSLAMYRKGYFTLSDGQKVKLKKAVFISDNTEALFQNAISGTGMFFAPNIFMKTYLEQGLLQRVVPQFSGPRADLVALYTNLDFIPEKTRLFLDHLKHNIADTGMF